MTWKKGQSGNPGGARKVKKFREAIELAVSEETPEGFKKLRALANKLVDEAIAGNVSAIKEIADRLDGKPTQALEHSASEDGPIILWGGARKED